MRHQKTGSLAVRFHFLESVNFILKFVNLLDEALDFQVEVFFFGDQLSLFIENQLSGTGWWWSISIQSWVLDG